MEQRILICSGADDGAGLRRCVGLAEGISRLLPDAITLLVASGDPEWMTLPERLVMVGLPGSGRTHSGKGAARAGAALRGRLLGDFVSEFHPDVVVVDGDSPQLLRQLEPPLRRLGDEARRPVLIVAARDVELPRMLRRARRGRGSTALERCDHALVLGDAEPSEAVLHERMADSRATLQHAGFLAPQPRAGGVAAARAAFGVDGPYVLCPIANVNAVPLAQAVLHELARRPDGLQPVVLAGPALGLELRGALRRSAPPGAIVRERRPALEDAIAGAAVVVTTLTDDAVPEAVVQGRPLVVVEEAGAVAEQQVRRHALAGLGYVRVLPRTKVRAGAVAAAVDALVAAPSPPTTWPAAGADRAAAMLAAALSQLPSARNQEPPPLQLPAWP